MDRKDSLVAPTVTHSVQQNYTVTVRNRTCQTRTYLELHRTCQTRTYLELQCQRRRFW